MLADVLSDPEVTRSIMAKATTPAQCLACASQRIAWHNASWENAGYGAWALRRHGPDGTSEAPIIGWCGLTPSSHGPTPEILYGLTRPHWGTGLATEAAGATIDWAFENDVCGGIDAVIFGRLNPGSAAVAKKLGMAFARKMPFAEFLPDKELGEDVLDYEIWRLREGRCIDVRALLFQAPFKAGLIVSAAVADEAATLKALVSAAIARSDRGGLKEAEAAVLVGDAFRMGLKECELDVYRLRRADWRARAGPR